MFLNVREPFIEASDEKVFEFARKNCEMCKLLATDQSNAGQETNGRHLTLGLRVFMWSSLSCYYLWRYIA